MEFLPAPDQLDPPAGEMHVWRLAAADADLRQVLAVYVGKDPERIRLAYGKHGKPRLAGAPNQRLEFNLSHSGDVALVAVSGEHAVGVDVERVRPRRGEDFYRRWACHEAQVKCLGVGLLRARRSLPEPVAVEELDLGAGYAAAVAIAASKVPPLRGWTISRSLPSAGHGVS